MKFVCHKNAIIEDLGDLISFKNSFLKFTFFACVTSLYHNAELLCVIS